MGDDCSGDVFIVQIIIFFRSRLVSMIKVIYRAQIRGRNEISKSLNFY